MFLHCLKDITILYQVQQNVLLVPRVHFKIAKDSYHAKVALLVIFPGMDHQWCKALNLNSKICFSTARLLLTTPLQFKASTVSCLQLRLVILWLINDVNALKARLLVQFLGRNSQCDFVDLIFWKMGINNKCYEYMCTQWVWVSSREHLFLVYSFISIKRRKSHSGNHSKSCMCKRGFTWFKHATSSVFIMFTSKWGTKRRLLSGMKHGVHAIYDSEEMANV